MRPPLRCRAAADTWPVEPRFAAPRPAAPMDRCEHSGAALAPRLASVIAVHGSLHVAIVAICVTTWLACAALLGGVAYLVPKDVKVLRQTMRQRKCELQRHRQPQRPAP